MKYFHSRTSRPGPIWWVIAKTTAQTLVFWFVFLFLIPLGIYLLEEKLGLQWWPFDAVGSMLTGSILFALGGLLGLTSGVVMAIYGKGTPLPADCAPELVIVGPYRYVRNPMAIAGLAQGIAVGIALGSPWVIVYALLGGPMWNVLVRPWEEADLEARFGETYRRYREQVCCWTPRLTGYRPASGA